MQDKFLFRGHTLNNYSREQRKYNKLKKGVFFLFKFQVANQEAGTLAIVMKMLLYETLTFDTAYQCLHTHLKHKSRSTDNIK